MEETKNMEWRKKLEMLKADIDALAMKASNLTGLTLSTIEACANQPTIEECMKWMKTKYLKIYPVHTQGARCIILGSSLYPEVGLLIFDGRNHVEGAQLKIIGDETMFRLVCGCCSPHKAGVGRKEYTRFEEGNFYLDTEKENYLHKSFALAVRTACKEQGITSLFFQCHSEYRMNQDQDGLHFFDWNNPDNSEKIDRWRFAVAFGEISISEDTSPFESVFTRKKS